MVWNLVVCLSLLSSSGISLAQNAPQSMVSYDEKFIMGVKHYALKKWSDAIIHLSQAMEEFKELELARLQCFKQCKGHKVKVQPELQDDEELQFFNNVITRAWCIRRCEEKVVGLTPWGGVSHYVLDQLKAKEGYNYIQMSLYQVGKHKEAAKASATFSYHNPHNTHIKSNVKYYKSLKDVTDEDLKPEDSLDYRELFMEGHQLFYSQKWEKMIQTFEDSLEHFFVALDDCRTLCDGPLKYDQVLDFAQTLTHFYLDKLECRVQCVKKLGDFRSDRREDFFGAYFHYLQRGYHQMNKSLQALQASAAQVQLEPQVEMAKKNSVFYLRQPGVTKKDFFPSQEYLPEILKREQDLKVFKLLRKLSGHASSKENWEEKKNEEEGVDELLLEEDFQQFPVGVPPLILDNIEPVVVQTSADFGGSERFVMDEILTQDQCQDLIQLASFGHEGDGYNRKSPHTLKEKFEGLHILDSARRSVNGEISKHLSWLYLNSSRVAKDLVAKEFDLQTPLYFSFTHLVCRTALEGVQENRNDLSHPVHSDNCILNEATGECDKVPPAYTWRDYSAILYLNEEFEGGDFFFAHSTKDLTPDVRVKPRCGRLVAFSAGKENLHGVTAVTWGKRCAIALWFTLDVNHKEKTFETAAEFLGEKSDHDTPL